MVDRHDACAYSAYVRDDIGFRVYVRDDIGL